jgi:hypothetical protein
MRAGPPPAGTIGVSPGAVRDSVVQQYSSTRCANGHCIAQCSAVQCSAVCSGSACTLHASGMPPVETQTVDTTTGDSVVCDVCVCVLGNEACSGGLMMAAHLWGMARGCLHLLSRTPAPPGATRRAHWVRCEVSLGSQHQAGSNEPAAASPPQTLWTRGRRREVARGWRCGPPRPPQPPQPPVQAHQPLAAGLPHHPHPAHPSRPSPPLARFPTPAAAGSQASSPLPGNTPVITTNTSYPFIPSGSQPLSSGRACVLGFLTPCNDTSTSNTPHITPELHVVVHCEMPTGPPGAQPPPRPHHPAHTRS